MHINDFRGKTIHFVGIGGISMSGLALILANSGYTVTGSDITYGPQVARLEQAGIHVFIGHDASNLGSAALVVYTAIGDNVELAYAREHNIPMMDRGALLGQISSAYENVIAVAGTHGKTTTTSMISTIFELCGQDPTIHVGSVLPLIGSSVKAGGTKYFITEACEYFDSFLQLHPTCAVILNLEMDHNDYFGTFERYQESFKQFLALVPSSGMIIADGEYENVMQLVGTRPVLTWGISKRNMIHPERIVYDDDGCASFDLIKSGASVAHVKLSVPGNHNVLNALAALTVAIYYGIDMQQAADALQQFKGADRRFQRKGTVRGATLIHDYAHHPTEIQITLQAAARIPHRELWCVFQPHTYTRTRALFDQFIQAFDLADHIILTDIYAAREKDDGSVSSAMLAERIVARGKDVRYIPNVSDVPKTLFQELQKNDMLITMGAGNIVELDRMLLE